MIRKELIIDETKGDFGVEAISLVDRPAIQEDFVYFSAEERYEMKADAERQMLVGPAMIPNKDIYRRDPRTGEEYNVFFSTETVQQCAHLFLRDSNPHATTLDHEKKASDVYVIESWIVEDRKNDKQQKYGFDLPEGTWMVSVKIDDAATWESIKSGERNGFSIEGYFADRLVSNFSHQNADMALIEQLKDLIAQFSAEAPAVEEAPVEETKQQFYAEAKLADGRTIATDAEAMEAGASIFVIDEEGNAEPLAEGEYELEGGATIKVDAEGKLIGEEEEATEEGEEPAEEVEEMAAEEVTEEVTEEVAEEAPATEEVEEEKEEEEEEVKEEFDAEAAIAELSASVAALAEAVKDNFAAVEDKVAELAKAPAQEFSHTPSANYSSTTGKADAFRIKLPK